MLIKGKLFLDVSYYESIQNWKDANPRPYSIIARATYGVRQDTSFADHWRQCTELGIIRQAFHYFYAKSWTSRKTDSENVGDQAVNFLDQINANGFTDEMLWMDWEEYGNEKAPTGYKLQVLMKQWKDHVERATGAEVGIYSRKDMLDKLAFTARDQRDGHGIAGTFPDWLKETWIWLAWYPYSNVVDSIPTFPLDNKRLMPSWLKPEKLAMWQFSDKYVDSALRDKENRVNAIDINQAYDHFLKKLGAPVVIIPPTPDEEEEHSAPFSNVLYHKVKRFGADCHILRIKGGRWEVTHFGYRTVKKVAQDSGADIVINGGDHRGAHAIGRYAVEGSLFSKQSEYEPFLNITKDNRVQILPYNSREKVWSAIAGKRFIVQNGAIAAHTSVSWKSKARRTLIGLDKSNNVVIVIVDGDVDLFQAAHILTDPIVDGFVAIDLDGGKSSQVEIPSMGLSVGDEEVGNHIVWRSE